MRIYFGEATDTEDFGTEGLLQSRGQFYDYMVEFGTNPGGLDDVVIIDGCGRTMPVALEHVKQLIKALQECHTIGSEIQEGEQLREFVESTDNTAAVCEHGHIHY